MRILALALVIAVGASPALASEEEIHNWKSTTVVAETSLFGDVEVKATGDAKGVTGVSVTIKTKTIVVPAKWLAKLPAMRLATIEVRSERGYDPQPWLYVVFRIGWKQDTVHLAFQGDKLQYAGTKIHDAKGAAKWTQIKAP